MSRHKSLAELAYLRYLVIKVGLGSLNLLKKRLWCRPSQKNSHPPTVTSLRHNIHREELHYHSRIPQNTHTIQTHTRSKRNSVTSLFILVCLGRFQIPTQRTKGSLTCRWFQYKLDVKYARMEKN